jgi:hypothetical protein
MYQTDVQSTLLDHKKRSSGLLHKLEISFISKKKKIQIIKLCHNCLIISLSNTVAIKFDMI